MVCDAALPLRRLEETDPEYVRGLSLPMSARPEYYVQTGSMLENPHGVPKDEVVRMVLENPAEITAQTVFGKYVESSGLVFTGELIQQLFDRSLPRVLSGSWIHSWMQDGRRVTAADEAQAFYKLYRWWGNRWFTGIDFARKTDFTVIFTIDIKEMPARVVYFKRLNRVPWETIYAEVGRVADLFGRNILFDSTGPGGDVIADALEGRNYCVKHHRVVQVGYRCLNSRGDPEDCRMEDYIPLSCAEGFQFSAQSKVDLIEHLRNCMSVGYHGRAEGQEFGWLRCPQIPQVEEEFSFYSWDDKKLDTDCLFALALAAWMGLEDVPRPAAVGSTYGQ